MRVYRSRFRIFFYFKDIEFFSRYALTLTLSQREREQDSPLLTRGLPILRHRTILRLESLRALTPIECVRPRVITRNDPEPY